MLYDGRSAECERQAPNYSSVAGNELVPADTDRWIQGLVAGWMEKHREAECDSEDIELVLLFQGRHLERFEECLDEKLAALEEKGELPKRRLGEDYPPEFLPVIVRAYDQASAETGWDPLTQLADSSRE